MDNKNKKKRESWRIIVFILAILLIVFLWARKDVVNIVATTPKEQIAPLVITTIAVSLLKILLIFVAVFLVGWLVGKIKNKNGEKL